MSDLIDPAVCVEQFRCLEQKIVPLGKAARTLAEEIGRWCVLEGPDSVSRPPPSPHARKHVLNAHLALCHLFLAGCRRDFAHYPLEPGECPLRPHHVVDRPIRWACLCDAVFDLIEAQHQLALDFGWAERVYGANVLTADADRLPPVKAERLDALRRAVDVLDSYVNPWLEELRKPKAAAAPVKATRGKGKNIEGAMLATLLKNPEAVYWSSNEWATHLECSSSTITGTHTWRIECSKRREAERLANGKRRRGNPRRV
jgi:hypothetical protein